VIQQAAAQLGLAEGLTRRLLTEYAVVRVSAPPQAEPETLLAHLTGKFAATSGVVDYGTLKTTFDGWFWANRIAALWKKWKLTLAEWEKIRALTADAQLLDFADVPLDATATAAPVDRFLRTSRLMRFKDSLPESGVTLLEVLERLNGGKYVTRTGFADDVQLLNGAWAAADVEAIVGLEGTTGLLGLAYPHDYLLAENWERLRRVFYFGESLNAGVDTVKTFAAANMTDGHAKALKELLRSKFGLDAWLTLSAEIRMRCGSASGMRWQPSY
jgi:hypothetical protein